MKKLLYVVPIVSVILISYSHNKRESRVSNNANSPKNPIVLSSSRFDMNNQTASILKKIDAKIEQLLQQDEDEKIIFYLYDVRNFITEKSDDINAVLEAVQFLEKTNIFSKEELEKIKLIVQHKYLSKKAG
ncbi:MAG: hypothetical protein GXO22_03250 [Aquificae bacterium]|nr:hypothetical protein [Aquificota bacterium]